MALRRSGPAGTSWEPGSGRGAYFHGGPHIGATDESNQVLGKGNSGVQVFRGACPND